MIRIEDKITVNAIAGTKTATANAVLEPGNIIGVKCFHKSISEFVRVQIKDSSDNELSKFTSIENFRDREEEYYKSFRPMYTEGGKKVTVNLISETNFATDTTFDFVFIYDTTNY